MDREFSQRYAALAQSTLLHRSKTIARARVVAIESGMILVSLRNSVAGRQTVERVVNSVFHNPIMLQNPYHNAYHTACMVLNCKAAAEFHSLSVHSTCCLIFAALFHDYEHSAGLHLDRMNITKAQIGLVEQTKNFFRPDDIDTILATIAVTEFPFIRTPSNMSEYIIRDCDLLQALEPDWFDQLFVGLFTEIQNKMPTLTFETFVHKQIAFMENSEFFTTWFAHEKLSAWNARLKEIKETLL